MTEAKVSYSESIEEIEEILSRIEQGDLDVDELTENVQRVTSLLKLCRKKLRTTEGEINKILENQD